MTKSCSVTHCKNLKNTGSRGWCSKHYVKWKKYGDPLGGKSQSPDKRIRFYENVTPGSSDECWNWDNPTLSGYGRVRIGEKTWLAHRLSWTIHNDGSIPEGLWVLHHCDNRSCVNPEHLYIGTHADNTVDATTRNRMAQGERNSAAILTARDVQQIRETSTGAYGEIVSLCREYGVSRSAMKAVLYGRSWKHVSPQKAHRLAE